MKDEEKSKEKLISELANLRQREAILEKAASDWKNAEKKLTVLDAVFEGTSDIVFAKDLHGRCEAINHVGAEFFGKPVNEIVGRDDSELFPAEVAQKIMAVDREVMTTGKVKTYEETIEHNGKSMVWQATKGPWRDQRGNLIGLIGIARDITDRRQVEEALRDNEEKFREMYEGSREAIAQSDMDGHILVANKAFQDLTGYSADELKKMTYQELTPKKWQEREAEIVKEYNGTGGLPLFEKEYQRKDGGVIPIELSGYISRDNNKRPTGIWVFIRNLTERKQAEEALKLDAAMLQNLAEGITLVGLDDGRIKYVNPRFEKMFGYEPGEMRGKHVTVVNAPTEKASEEVMAEIVHILEETGEWHGEIENIKKDGTRFWCYANVSLFEHPEYGRVVISVHTDINEHKRAEEARETLQAQLAQAQKMESVGRLAGGVAHDFNNMLEVILGHTELVMVQVNPEEPLHDSLNEIKEAAHRSANLVRQLLAFARKQAFLPKVLDLNDSISATLKMLRRLIGEDIKLAWIPGAELWSAKIDPTQIDQILANLCVNARDAIAGPGRVTIEMQNVVADEAYCADHAGFVCGEYVMFSVSDDGRGMDKDVLEHLFEPFFTTKEEGKGTGLGLSTVYGIVKQNDGFVGVDSESGKGTTVEIYLPRVAEEVEEIDSPSVVDAPQCGGETVLIVEDERVILKLGQMMLERRGYTVLAASTPGEAVRLSEEHVDEIDLLITDVIMPEMNGRELSGELLSLYPNIKRLFMSGYTANVIAQHGVLDEGMEFLQKPFTMKDLATKVNSVLRQK